MSEDATWKVPERSGISADWQINLAHFKASLPMIREAFEVIAGTYPEYAAQYKRYFDALVRTGYTLFGLTAQLRKEPLPEQCDRLFAFVGRGFTDVLWGFSGLPEVLGWVNDETRTHGYIVAGLATVNQIFMPPANVLRHELLHALGCEHAITLAGCYQQIAKLKGARSGEFFPAWDAERGTMLVTRQAAMKRMGGRQ